MGTVTVFQTKKARFLQKSFKARLPNVRTIDAATGIPYDVPHIIP